MVKVDNAIILAAGTSSRFAPLSFEKPKSLYSVKGEVLIERQIRQLKDAGINQIIIVVGYMKEQFEYLKDKFNVILVENNDYLSRNNNGSIYAARKFIKNSYICSSDNYFIENPFKAEEEYSYYSAVYSNGKTNEWCIDYDDNGLIKEVKIGGTNSWYMLGHTFWDEDFTQKFLEILYKDYNNPNIKNLLWETIYVNNIQLLKMKIKKFPNDFIFEFDTLDELRKFDNRYIFDSHSKILKDISELLSCQEKDLVDIESFKENDNSAVGFYFKKGNKKYKYYYKTKKMEEILQ